MKRKQQKLSPTASATELLLLIEKKDSRFRLFQTLFMVGTFILLIIVILAMQSVLNEIKQQNERAKEVAVKESKENEVNQEKIIRRLNCMVIFFSHEDRTNLSIDNIDKCSLNRDKNVNQFFDQPESTPSESPPSLQPSATPQNDAAPTPSNDNGNNGNQNQDKDNGAEERPPITGVPLLDSIIRGLGG